LKTLLVRLICSVLSFLIPTQKKLLLFGSWYGNKYGDNPRYFFEWHLKNTDYQCYWITKNSDVYKDLKAKNINVLYGNSLKAIWFHLRAKAVFCNCSPNTDLFGRYLNRKTIIFNLWHGTPIKKIGFDAISSDISSERLGVKRSGFISRNAPNFIKIVKNKLLEKELYYLASSTKVATLLSSAMGVDINHIIVAGYPKLDHLIQEIKQPIKGSILYAPTYRGEYNSENDLLTMFGFDPEKMNLWLTKHDKNLTIRLHPANTLPESLKLEIAKMDRLSLGGDKDLYEEITEYEMVITDFSSLYYDAISINIKTIMAPFGLESYLNEDRQLYFQPEELFPYEMAKNWPELINLLPQYFHDEIDLLSIRESFYNETEGEGNKQLWNKIRDIIN